MHLSCYGFFGNLFSTYLGMCTMYIVSEAIGYRCLQSTVIQCIFCISVALLSGEKIPPIKFIMTKGPVILRNCTLTIFCNLVEYVLYCYQVANLRIPLVILPSGNVCCQSPVIYLVSLQFHLGSCLYVNNSG